MATELGHELAKRGHEVHFISYGVPFRLNLRQENIFFHEVNVNAYPLFKYIDYSLPLSVKMAEVSKQNELDILHVQAQGFHLPTLQALLHSSVNLF